MYSFIYLVFSIALHLSIYAKKGQVKYLQAGFKTLPTFSFGLYSRLYLKTLYVVLVHCFKSCKYLCCQQVIKLWKPADCIDLIQNFADPSFMMMNVTFDNVLQFKDAEQLRVFAQIGKIYFSYEKQFSDGENTANAETILFGSWRGANR